MGTLTHSDPKKFVHRSARLFLAAVGFLCHTSFLQAEEWRDLRSDPQSRQRSLNKLSNKGSLRVIVVFETPDDGVKRVQKAMAGRKWGSGNWINFNDEVARLQQEGIKELGWTNFNDIVQFKSLPAMALEADAIRMESLLVSRSVKGVFEDKEYTLSMVPNLTQIGAPSVWAENADGHGQVVAIVDSGVDASHPMLKGKVIAEACFSDALQLSGGLKSESLCPNGKSIQQGPGSARPCDSGCDHGTHVAGIAAGRFTDKAAGVAPGSNIIAVNVFHRIVDQQGQVKGFGSSDSEIMHALEWLQELSLTQPIAAINMSLGGEAFPGPCDTQVPYMVTLRTLREWAKIPVVAASGNESQSKSIANPACFSNILSVGAVDVADLIPAFSNSAHFLSLLAPGVDISSSIPNGKIGVKQGTSMAAPHVAGAIAVLRSAYPMVPLEELLKTLKETGIPLSDPRNGITTPRIDLKQALARLDQNAKKTPKPASPTNPKQSPPVESPSVGGIRIYDKGGVSAPDRQATRERQETRSPTSSPVRSNDALDDKGRIRW